MVPVARLRAICDPFQPVWDTPDRRRCRITQNQVQRYLERRVFEEAPFVPESDAGRWMLSRHAKRVAFLAAHGWSDPVQIDVGVPHLLCHVGWPLIDGNHRLAAAIVRGDEFIASDVSGSCSHAFELLGVRP